MIIQLDDSELNEVIAVGFRNFLNSLLDAYTLEPMGHNEDYGIYEIRIERQPAAAER